MADDDTPPSSFAFPADSEAEDARWLASLIHALRAHASVTGHPEVAVALADAFDAARSLAQGRRSGRTAH